MTQPLDRREFFKSSLLKTGAGLFAWNGLFGGDLLGAGARWIPASERGGRNTSFCHISPAEVHYRVSANWVLTYASGAVGLPVGRALAVRCLNPILPENQLSVTSSDPGFTPQVTLMNNVGIERVIWIEPDKTPLPPGGRLIIRLKNYKLPTLSGECAFAICEVDQHTVRVESEQQSPTASRGRFVPPKGRSSSGMEDPEAVKCLTFLEVPTSGGKILPWDTEDYNIVLPSRAIVGEPIRVRISALDHEGLATPAFTGTLSLRTPFPFQGLPARVTFLAEDQGSKTLTVIPVAPGIARIKVSDGVTTVESNPCVCTEEPVENHIFWGEYHKHCYHDDGHLEPEEHFDFASRFAHLDWAMLTPHDAWPAPRKGARNLDLIQAATEAAHRPGEFVTFHGYEWTHDKPFSPDDARGHKVIMFLDPEKLLPLIKFTYGMEEFDPEFMPPTTLLHRLLKRAGNDVIVIPHHLPLYKWWVFPSVPAGAMGGPLPAMDREQVDAVQPVAEVFSKVHGMNESWAMQNWIKKPTSFFGAPILHTFWLDALKEGARVGAVCAGDNHYLPMGHRLHTALCGVLSADLTREGIFRAIQERRTIGTSGHRVLIDFRVGGARIGEIKKLKGGWVAPRIQVNLVSPVPIGNVEVVRVKPGLDEVPHVHDAGGDRETSFVWEDAIPARAAWVCYYLRIHLDDDTAGAWTSPIWIEV